MVKGSPRLAFSVSVMPFFCCINALFNKTLAALFAGGGKKNECNCLRASLRSHWEQVVPCQAILFIMKGAGRIIPNSVKKKKNDQRGLFS